MVLSTPFLRPWMLEMLVLGTMRNLCRANQCRSYPLSHWKPQLAEALEEDPGCPSKPRQLICSSQPWLFLRLMLEVRALSRVTAQLQVGISQLVHTQGAGVSHRQNASLVVCSMFHREGRRSLDVDSTIPMTND